MNKLLKEFLSYILVEEERDPKATYNDPRGIPNGLYHKGRGKYYNKNNEYVGKVVDNKWYAAGTEPKITQTKAQRDADAEKTAKDNTAAQKTKGRGADYIGGVDPKTLQQKPVMSADDVKPSASADDTDDTSPASKIAPSISTPVQIRKKEILDDIQTAIESGDPKTIQKVIDDYDLRVSASVKPVLKAGKEKEAKSKSSDSEQKNPQDITNGDIELSKKLIGLMVQSGATIKGSKKSQDGEEKVSSDNFKPQNVFAEKPLDQLDVTTDASGNITIEGKRVSILSDTQIDRVIDAAAEAYKRRGLQQDPPVEISSAQEKQFRILMRKRLKSSNRSIEYLQNVAKKGESLEAYQFNGDEGKKEITTALGGLIDTHVPEENRQEAHSALAEMSSARTPAQFNEAYKKFVKAVKKTPIYKHMKYNAETITALRVLALSGPNGIALIPKSDSFPLSDVLSLRENPLTGEIEVTQLVVDFLEGMEVTAAGSVKFLKGAGSKNQGKIENSEFDDGIVDEVDCKDVERDLMDMTDISSRNTIFRSPKEVITELSELVGANVNVPKEKREAARAALAEIAKARTPKELAAAHKKFIAVISDPSAKYNDATMAAARDVKDKLQAAMEGKPSPEAKAQIMGWLQKYGPMVRAYYGIEDDMTDDELYEFLSYGKEMACIGGKPAGSADGEPFSQAKKQNGQQWRAWSVVGRMTEAVHNRTLKQQFYHTVRYEDDIVVADGITTFSKMEFQSFKNESAWAAGGGLTRPDQAQNAFTIPSTPEETRSGNPCKSGEQSKSSKPKRTKSKGSK